MRSAWRQLTPSPQLIDTLDTKPCRIRKVTLDGLPEVYRKVAYALQEKGELEIIGNEVR